jgi:hypothetical protein
MISFSKRLPGLPALALVIFLPAIAAADFQKKDSGHFEVDGYEIECSAQQKGGDLHLRGRVRYGDYCDRLKLTVSLRNDDGETAKVVTEVSDVGGSGSRTLREETSLMKRDVRSDDSKWEITRIRSSCLD